MLHLAGATIQFANLVNYNCHLLKMIISYEKIVFIICFKQTDSLKWYNQILKAYLTKKKPENLIHKTLNNISDGTIKLQQSPTKNYLSVN